MSGEAHLRSALRWLDLVIHREIVRLRASYQLSLDEFRGLYVGDAQVDALVRGAAGAPDAAGIEAAAARARAARDLLPADSPFAHLAREYGLSMLEQDILLVALAPDIAPKYATLYAYLNNDVTRTAANPDLIARLAAASPDARRDVLAAVTCDAPLLAHGLLRGTAAPDQQQPWMNAGLRPHRALPAYLMGLGYAEANDAVSNFARARLPDPQGLGAGVRERLHQTQRAWSHDAPRAPVWVLHGRDETLRAAAAAALCRMFDMDLLRLDLAALPRGGDDLAAALRDALMRQRLIDACLEIVGIERTCDVEGRPGPEAAALMRLLRGARRPVFIGCDAPAPIIEIARGLHLIPVDIPSLDLDGRAQAWTQALEARGLSASRHAIGLVAGGFPLMDEQIQRAAQALADEQPDDAAPEVPQARITAAARSASDQSIARLAQRMAERYTWDDLVLPAPATRRLREIVHAVRDRHLVFGEWGLARRAGGHGLRVLFAGPSGTGKTMAAATIAREVGVDIYRIDISQTVSKYIGETEKNLDRVFCAAEHANAVLFFDEADSLFGKRSEVKDAHDRYSNIETAYLLQRIEDYDGVVFLASNLSRNIDNAFSRRLNFVVDFPLPDRHGRERLWRVMLANGVPVAADVDFAFLAAQFPLSGGDIRNVTLEAAFLAARSQERRVTMKSVVVALGREIVKQGRVPSPAEFKHHHALVVENA